MGLENIEKAIIIGGTFIILSAVFAVIMTIKFPEASPLTGIPTGMMLGMLHFIWYHRWKS